MALASFGLVKLWIRLASSPRSVLSACLSFAHNPIRSSSRTQKPMPTKKKTKNTRRLRANLAAAT